MVIVDLSLLLTLPVTSFGIRQSEWHANARAGRPSDSAILPDGAYGAALLFNGLDNHVGLIPPGEKLSKQRAEERHADQNHDKAFNRNVRDSGYPPALHATLAGRRRTCQRLSGLIPGSRGSIRAKAKLASLDRRYFHLQRQEPH